VLDHATDERRDVLGELKDAAVDQVAGDHHHAATTTPPLAMSGDGLGEASHPVIGRQRQVVEETESLDFPPGRRRTRCLPVRW